MGVIVYVSLSGLFPFVDDQNIQEQLMDTNSLFPLDTWATVSQDGS